MTPNASTGPRPELGLDHVGSLQHAHAAAKAKTDLAFEAVERSHRAHAALVVKLHEAQRQEGRALDAFRTAHLAELVALCDDDEP